MFPTTRPIHYQPRPPAPKIDEASQPWTTARCHRLLRPLVSRIASLRKDALIGSHTAASIPYLAAGQVAVAPTCGSGADSDADSGLLGPRKKRPRHTYAQRRGPRVAQPQSDDRDGVAEAPSGARPVVKRPFKCIQSDGRRNYSSPGKLIAATPVLRRARGEAVISPAAPVPKLDLTAIQAGPGRMSRSTRCTSGAQKRSDERLIGLRKSLPAQYADLEAIFRSLEALLKATAPSFPNDIHITKGPRSLMAMCLRKVPQYIIELEAWERLEAEQGGTISTLDGIDTSAQIYNHLEESLGTNVGWRHLRVVVRADGVHAVKRAMEDGLFEDQFSKLLIDLCVQLGAASEAEELVTAFVDRQYPQPASAESRFTPKSGSQPLVILNNFADQTRRTSFLFRQYTSLLSTGNLPADWLATIELERVWGLAVQAIAKDTPNHDAINFMKESIALLSNWKRTMHGAVDTAQRDRTMARASQRTLISALAILASMAVLGDDELKTVSIPESELRRVLLMGDRLRYVLRSCIHGIGSLGRGRGMRNLDILYLALFFSSGQSVCEATKKHVKADFAKLSSVVETSSSLDARMRNHYDSIALLIASIARDCSRGKSTASHECLSGLFSRLECLDLDKHLADSLKAAAAFLVAQQTNSVRDLIYAEKLHSHDRTSSDAGSDQPSGRMLFTGYRWDETIGEWVTVSPESKKQRKPTGLKRARSTPELNASSVSIRATRSTRTVLSRLRFTETTQSREGSNTPQSETEENIRTARIGDSISLTEKRPGRLQSNETLSSVKSKTKGPLPEQSFTTSASSISPGSQFDADKENRVNWLAKKPRRSSSSAAADLATRQPGRYSVGGCSRRRMSGREKASSDDELCL